MTSAVKVVPRGLSSNFNSSFPVFTCQYSRIAISGLSVPHRHACAWNATQKLLPQRFHNKMDTTSPKMSLALSL